MRPFSLPALLACSLGIASAQHVGVPTDDLDKVGVDELFNVQVTSVGRKAQELSKAPAAVFVLTADDIRRSGATSIPEALEWVPGLTVLSLDGRSWAISARGGARLFANQMLVMIDGRSLYTPLFSGVIWDALDVPLDDIEQIEVIRGPGAVMWGPNAVNGVINIITQKAQATKGGSASMATGNELRGAAEARWGGAVGDRLAYRVWGEMEERSPGYGSPAYYNLGDFTYVDPSLKDLNWATGRFGFRVDSEPTAKDQLMIQGDLYRTGRQDAIAYTVWDPGVVELQPGHTDYDGGYIQSRWTHTSGTGSETVVQFSFDHNNIDFPFIDGRLSNLNFDFQNRRQTGERNEIYWGAGFQQYQDDTQSTRLLAFDPASFLYRSGDVVVRDEWQIWPDRLVGSAGIRLDYNSYKHVEYQPSFRLLYTPDKRQSVWIAYSRAVRMPDRADRDIQYDGGQTMVDGTPIALPWTGTPTLCAEVERSLEAGYRLQSGQHWSIDLSVFRSLYSRLVAYTAPLVPQIDTSGPAPSFQMPFVAGNIGAGSSTGVETSSTWEIRPGWRILPSYSYVKYLRWLPDVPGNFQTWAYTPSDLRHQGSVRIEHDISRSWQFDVMGRARSRDLVYQTPGVLLVDARLSFRPFRSGELSVSIKNLADRRVMEAYSEEGFPSISVRRTFVLKWTERF